MAVEPRRIGVVRVELSWPEANQTLAAQQTRAVFLQSLLEGTMSPETRAYLASALVDTRAAEGRLSVVLMGDDLDDGNHYAGMPPR